MNLRVLWLGLVLFAFSVSADAQPTGTIWRIGQLGNISDGINLGWWREFREQLRELGYVEGQNVAFEARFGQGLPEELPRLAAELVRLQVHVIVVASTAGALAAKRATST